MNYYYITKLSLIVSDEEIKEGSTCFNSYQETEPYTIYNIHVGGKDWEENKKAFKTIIAGTPELPSINYSKLSPEEQNRLGWIDVEGLSNSYLNNLGSDSPCLKKGFKAGLTHQLSIKRYTEEELLHSLKVAFTAGFEHSRLANNPMNMFVDSYIKSLNQPELIPIEIETEDWKAAGEGGLGYKTQIPRPKITNNQITITKIL